MTPSSDTIRGDRAHTADSRHSRRRDTKIRQQPKTEMRLIHKELTNVLANLVTYRDKETGEHIWRMGQYCRTFAEALGWPEEKAEDFCLAAQMHDIGKIGIPDAILQKPGKLTAEEFEIMKQHTTMGAGMLAGSHLRFLQMARDVARHHHEHWDGTGYPDGLAGLEIPAPARILTIVNVYDALSHDRVYKSAYAESRVLALMKKASGKHFDPRLLIEFFRLMPKIRA